ncbi:endoplasmic reticulum membrane-associated RNA degradation protein isoform X3 [Sphaerodactylus townsendi]|uniref:endoplasmic reticulum membrane-associated RNA degradation protein isoform X3 n=1 Tax=Sphaerodactylus townsendi TaxID=933632 RepID=UPI002025C3FB|nr:endoplasmic reticulum membrane-associated RNA degradation protein isoform X3 [Sphaerodactylus townsendi]
MLSFFAPVTCGRGGPLSFFFFSMAHLYPACPATRRKGCVCVMRYILPTKSNRFQPTDEVDRSLKVETSMCDVTKRDARQRHGNDQEEMEGNAVQGSKAAVAGACSTILDHDLVTTCLSSKVRFMVCELGFERKANYAVHTFVTGNAQIYWKTIVEHVHYSETDHSVDYVKSVRSLGPLCESVHLHLQTLTMEQFEEQFVMWFQWTRSSEIFLEMFGILKCPHSTAIELSLMKLTSCLERALGDVFLLIGKDCPFLLRDLLASWELSTIFGQSVMDVLRVFIGSPDGLNLRNILWHGFASPQEIPVKYVDCVMLLLSQLESGLRLLFTTVNNCPSRLITAETSFLYTTFDEMLAKQLSNEEINKLPLVLGESAMEFLWDFLNHQEGPRIRDHLSHGEISLNNFPKEIANSLLAFSVTLLSRYSKDEIAAVKEHAFLRPLVSCANNYCSQCHPIALLKKQILQCVKSINLWSELPVVPNEQEMTGSEDFATAHIVVIADIFSLVQVYLPQDIKLPGGSTNSLITEMLMVELCRKPVRMLFCPRSVLEVTVVLRQISVQCHQVSCQVISSCETRYNQWVNKSLRSRQRHNYLRLRRSIKCVSRVFKLILMLITLELISIHAVCDKNPTEYQQYLKSLKLILQYMENLVTYTSPEKNKWDETLDLTYKALIKIRTFLEKHQMLMQLAR